MLEVLRGGFPLVFPTDTVYGIGAAAFDPAARDALYRLKGRDPRKPLPYLIDSLEAARRYAVLGKRAERLARRWWPGPLTLVLKARPAGRALAGPGGTVGFRVPGPPMLRDLLRRLGAPLASTSANASGAGASGDPRRAAAPFRGKIPLALDGGPLPGAESTVADLSRRTLKVLREGAVAEAEIRRVLS